MRHSFAVAVVLFVISAVSACTDSRPASLPKPDSETSANASGPAAEDTNALARLESLEADIKRDQQGFIIDVDLRKTSATDEDLPQLAALTKLRSLHLDGLPITDVGIAALQNFSGPLASLNIRDCSISDSAMDSLSSIRSLRAIRMSGDGGATNVSDEGMAALAALPQLKVLALDGLWISTSGIERLLPLNGLEELYLKSTLVDDDSMRVVAGFPNMKKLRISKTQVSNEGLKHLTACRRLEELDLSENSLLDDAGMIHVGALSSMKKLNLWRVAVSDVGIARLEPLSAMEWLNLDNTQLTDAGLSALKNMSQLSFLHLGSTSVSDAGLPALKHLTALRDLKVTRTAVTEAGVADLQKALPNTAIQIKYIEGE